MVEDDGGATLPVVFSNGEREISTGSVKIHPITEYKNLQMSLSHRIGISPNQITVYLRAAKSSPEARRRVPITGKADFACIAKVTDCFFLVVLKRSRSSRKSKPKQGEVKFGHFDFQPEPEKVLLRRNQPDLTNPQVFGYVSPHYNQIPALEFGDYNERLQNLQIQRENYARMMNLEFPKSDSDFINSFPVTEDGYRASQYCEECASAGKQGITALFHCCAFDPVIEGFRTTTGPIARLRRAVQ